MVVVSIVGVENELKLFSVVFTVIFGKFLFYLFFLESKNCKDE